MAASTRDAPSVHTAARPLLASVDTFELRSIGGRLLPRRYAGAAWQWDCPVDVERAVLILSADSTLLSEAYGRVFCDDETPMTGIEPLRFRGNYETAGDSLELGVEYDGGNFIVLASALRRADTLDVLDSAGLVLRYVRRGMAHR